MKRLQENFSPWFSPLLFGGIVFLLGAGIFPATSARGGGPTGADVNPAGFASGDLLVKFKDGTPERKKDEIKGSAGVFQVGRYEMTGIERVRLKPGFSAREAADVLQGFPEVEYSEADSFRRPFAAPNDPEFFRQWFHINTGQVLRDTFPRLFGKLDADIDSTEAWELVFENSGLLIAVIDSGVDFLHPDILGEDLNRNGVFDTDEDINRNRNFDTEDLNNNGFLDPGEDLNGNGILDTEDLNGNGVLDTNEDFNTNRMLDPGEDLNGNGVLDTNEDFNRNRLLDAGEDLNLNGWLDTFEDFNGNQILDGGVLWFNEADFPDEDANINGLLDKGEDLNGNGLLDSGDANSDGCPGLCGVDDDGDGLVDEDGSGVEQGDPAFNPAYINDDDENGLIDDFQGWNFFGSQSCSVIDNQCRCSPDDPLGNENILDDHGHGTALAGVISSLGNNHYGGSGVLWASRVLPLKFLGPGGCGSVADEIQAIEYAVKKKARIIVLGSGGGSFNRSEFDAIRAAGDAGVLVVAPAGNSRSNNDLNPVYPAGYDLPNLISIAATSLNDELFFLSNYGKKTVDTGAPGDCIYTTLPTNSFGLQNETNLTCTSLPFSPNFDYVSGTSIAAGIAGGSAGLLLTLNPFLTPEEIKTLLVISSDPTEALKEKVASGGRLNISQALAGDIRSSLTGGTGGNLGCGAFISPDGEGKAKGPGAFVLIFLLFILSLGFFRRGVRWVLRRAGLFLVKVFIPVVVLGFLSPVFAQGNDVQQEAEKLNSENGFHFLTLKTGLHFYRRSQYFSTNSAFFDERDFVTPIGELEYDYLFYKRARIGLAGGFYGGRTRFEGICCSKITFKTRYYLATLKLEYRVRFARIPPIRLFGGPGLGYYYFQRKIKTSGLSDTFFQELDGFHFTGGFEIPLGDRLNFLAEGRYAVVRIKSANLFNDRLDIGGISTFLGFSWVFG